MTNGRKSGTEPFKVGPIELEGTAGAGLVAFWQELATCEVEGIGKVTIGNSALGGLGLFAFLPIPEGRGADCPPTTFILDLKPLASALIGAAVERFKTGEPAVWEEINDPSEDAITAGREAIAKRAETDGENQFAREVRAGAWDHREDVAAAIEEARS